MLKNNMVKVVVRGNKWNKEEGGGMGKVERTGGIHGGEDEWRE